MHFLMTTNKQSADALKKAGFSMLNENNGTFIFLNNEKLTFSNINNVIPTNKIMF